MSNQTRHYEVVGAAFDLGSTKRGCANAPQFLRENGLLPMLDELRRSGVDVTDVGAVQGPSAGDPEAWPRNLPQLVSFGERLMERLGGSYRSGRVPVVIGGDHSISIPSVSSAASFLRSSSGTDAELGLLWVDAHPDLETPDCTPSGNLHGMSVAHLLGYGAPELARLGGFGPKLKPANVVFIGLRDVLKGEKALIEKHEIPAYMASDVAGLGIGRICQRALGRMAETAGFVLSFDMDACDPSEAPGVQFPERGGLTRREATVIMESVAQAPNLLSVELVEYNPSLDADLRTAELAIHLIRTVLEGGVAGPLGG